MSHLAQRVAGGEATSNDIDLLFSVASQIENKCLCPLGEFSIMPVISGLKHFRKDFEDRIQ
jgi:NADH-quinone oxidoreductase subunit F